MNGDSNFSFSQMQKNLRIIVLENPYENWTQPKVPDLFKNLVELKRLGYEGFYPFGFLPLDTGDLVATHLMICEETENELIPICAYRSLSLSQCESYHLTFPAISALSKDKGSESHLQSVELVINRVKEQNKQLTFSSGWTVHPKVRKNREKVDLMKNITRAMFYLFQDEFGSHEEIGFGVPKVKTDIYFSQIGYDRMTLDGNILEPIAHTDIGGEPIVLIHRTNFTSAAIEAAERHRELWENKISIRVEQSAKKREAA